MGTSRLEDKEGRSYDEEVGKGNEIGGDSIIGAAFDVSALLDEGAFI